MDAADTTAPGLDLNGAAVLVVSRQGRIEYASNGACTLFGYAVDQLVGSKISVIIPEQYRERHWAGWGRAWSRDEVPTLTPVMIPVLCADGTVRRFVSSLMPIRAPHGQLLAIAAVWGPPSARDDGVRLLT